MLSGAEVANGNLRGTALVVLLVGVPTLLTAMVGTARGSPRWLVLWLGTLGYVLYQAVPFCFGTPLNGLFLCYVAYLGLGVWSIVALFPAVDQRVFGSSVSVGMPARSIAAFAFAIAAVNAAVWLAAIVPALLRRDRCRRSPRSPSSSGRRPHQTPPTGGEPPPMGSTPWLPDRRVGDEDRGRAARPGTGRLRKGVASALTTGAAARR